MSQLPWYANHENLASLWRFLEERGEDPEDPAYFMEKPWKWQTEWEQYEETLERS